MSTARESAPGQDRHHHRKTSSRATSGEEAHAECSMIVRLVDDLETMRTNRKELLGE